MTLGNSLGQIFWDNHWGLSTVYTKVLVLERTKTRATQNVATFILHNFAEGRRFSVALCRNLPSSPWLHFDPLFRGKGQRKLIMKIYFFAILHDYTKFEFFVKSVWSRESRDFKHNTQPLKTKSIIQALLSIVLQHVNKTKFPKKLQKNRRTKPSPSYPCSPSRGPLGSACS